MHTPMTGGNQHHGGSGQNSSHPRQTQKDVPDAPEMRFPKGRGNTKTPLEVFKEFLLDLLPQPRR